MHENNTDPYPRVCARERTVGQGAEAAETWLHYLPRTRYTGKRAAI